MIYVIPLIIALVLITAMIKKLPSYELFIDGAEEGMKIVSGIFPPLVAVLTAAYMLRASGTLDLIVSLLSPINSCRSYAFGAYPSNIGQRCNGHTYRNFKQLRCRQRSRSNCLRYNGFD